MAWFDEAVFYHIYPLGMTGAPKQNSYTEAEHRLNTLLPMIVQIKNLLSFFIFLFTSENYIGKPYCNT